METKAPKISVQSAKEDKFLWGQKTPDTYRDSFQFFRFLIGTSIKEIIKDQGKNHPKGLEGTVLDTHGGYGMVNLINPVSLDNFIIHEA